MPSTEDFTWDIVIMRPYLSFRVPNEKVEKLNDLLLFGSAGRRWNLGKHLYVLAGIQFGLAFTFSDDTYSSYTLDPETGTYLKEESYYMEWPSAIYPYPLPELSIGIAF